MNNSNTTCHTLYFHSEETRFKSSVWGKFEQYKSSSCNTSKLILYGMREHAASQLTWLGEAQQRQVNILAVLLARDDEVKNLEVLAADHQRASSGRGGQFLHAAHQTVKNLEGTISKNICICIYNQKSLLAFVLVSRNLPMIHCATPRCCSPPRRWCGWPSGTGCPVGSSWATACRGA